MKRLISALLASCLLLPLHAQEDILPNTVEVAVKRVHTAEQSTFELQASGVLSAAPARVWAVLTDYHRLPEFVPNLLSCRVVSRNGNEVVIEQTGSTGLLFFRKTVHIVVRAVETPPSRIDIALISGDMKHYVVRWELVPVTLNGAPATRLLYTASLEPDFFVPPLFGTGIVQADVQKMMQAVVAEILETP